MSDPLTKHFFFTIFVISKKFTFYVIFLTRINSSIFVGRIFAHLAIFCTPAGIIIFMFWYFMHALLSSFKVKFGMSIPAITSFSDAKNRLSESINLSHSYMVAKMKENSHFPKVTMTANITHVTRATWATIHLLWACVCFRLATIMCAFSLRAADRYYLCDKLVLFLTGHSEELCQGLKVSWFQ